MTIPTSEEIVGLQNEVGRLATALERYKKLLFSVVAVLCIDLTLSVIVGYVTVRDLQFRNCMQHWAQEYTARSTSLTGPSSGRFTFLLDAFRAALGEQHELTPAARQRLVAELDHNRAKFPLIPPLPKLMKLPDSQLLVFHDVLLSIDADDMFNRVSASHPVPIAPTCGGIL